jgi:hypothetical protein
MTEERSVARLAREAKFIVACEADDGSWFELDATDRNHAGFLAENQVDKMNCRGASCWTVLPTGKLSRRSFSTYFASTIQWVDWPPQN